MQVTNEIRHAFLFAVLDLGNAKNQNPLHRKTATILIAGAFEAKETEDLMKWLTLQEKVRFGQKLLELTGGIDPSGSDRTLQSDLTEDRS